MKSWLRRLANSFSRKPERAAETTWHAEDFRPAPERPAPLDPWAAELAVATLREATAPPTIPPPISAPLPGLEVPAPEEVTAQIASGCAALSQDATSWPERDTSHSYTSPLPESFPPESNAPALDWFEPEASQPHASATADNDILPNGTAPDVIQSAPHDASAAPVCLADWGDFDAIDPPPGFAASTVTLSDEFDLPDYDPDLSQRLGDAEWAAKAPRDSLARQRAAMIAALLDVTSRHEAETALQWLEAFFLEHRWSATFRALETAALEGLDFPTLQAMAALKDIWAERPEWWLRRTRTVRANLGGTATERMPRGDTALSWRLARRICLARCDFLPEDMIDPDWLAEWYALSPNEPGASFFPTFLAEKVQALLAEALHEGLIAKARDYEPPSQGHHRLAPRQPLTCGPDGEMISPVMVDATGQRKNEVKDDS